MPFRLTKALISPMGFYQEKGLFWTYFYEAHHKYKANEGLVWIALVNFDP